MNEIDNELYTKVHDLVLISDYPINNTFEIGLNCTKSEFLKKSRCKLIENTVNVGGNKVIINFLQDETH